jgi:hypothetical protein
MTQPPITMEQISELETLAAAASPGPWRAGAVDTFHVFIPNRAPGALGPERVLLRMNEHFPFEADAAFIAAAREAVPALIARVRTLRGVVELGALTLCKLAVHMGVAKPNTDALPDGPAPLWEAWTKAQERIAALEADLAEVKHRYGRALDAIKAHHGPSDTLAQAIEGLIETTEEAKAEAKLLEAENAALRAKAGA